MPYHAVYHADVTALDLPRINRNIQRRILRAIETRLLASPEHYGDPLTGNLAGYWKLRSGDYRIVFKVTGSEIYIYTIRHRKDAYTEILKRVS